MKGAAVVTAPETREHGAWFVVTLDSLGEKFSFALTPHAALELTRKMHTQVPGFVQSLNKATVIKFPSAKKRGAIRLNKIIARQKVEASNA